MRGARRPAGALGTALVGLLLVTGACSDDESVAPATTGAPASLAKPSAATVPITALTTVPITVPTTAPTTEPTIGPVEDTGVPGLDSDDAFCAAWSRFGGSWQVVLTASAFGDPADAARLEVIASSIVGDAYDAIFEVWPDELVGEEAVVADQYFGAFQRRSADARSALDAAGASDDDVERLATAWVDALARRDPAEAVIDVEVPTDIAEVVDEAATAFAAARVSLTVDPSMVITASTPLTDDYLATACPDQGSITGQDVIGS